MQRRDLTIFEPTIVASANGLSWRLILPPTVEHHDGSYYVVDGVHRLYAARSKGLKNVTVSVVWDVGMPLPTTPRQWGELMRVDKPMTAAEIVGPHDEKLFRPIAKRLGRICFPSRTALDKFFSQWSNTKGDCTSELRVDTSDSTSERRDSR
jgi:hypothetical protein